MSQLRSTYVFERESDYEDFREHLYREMPDDYNDNDKVWCRGWWGSCSQFDWSECYRVEIYSECTDAPRVADLIREHRGRYYNT